MRCEFPAGGAPGDRDALSEVVAKRRGSSGWRKLVPGSSWSLVDYGRAV